MTLHFLIGLRHLRYLGPLSLLNSRPRIQELNSLILKALYPDFNYPQVRLEAE